MESPDSSTISSPEVAPKRSVRMKSPTPDDKDRRTYIKFLVSNAAAGSIIGKGGSTITEFQTQSGARIQLSRNHEFFPGTSDRIILINGEFSEIIKAMELILEKLMSEVHSGDGDDDVDPRSKLRLVVPNSSCGGIIGKGGSTIKSFIEDSQAGIKISPQDHNFIGLNDRVVTLTGSLDEQMRATILILSKLREDAHYTQFTNVPFSYTAYNVLNYGANGFGATSQNDKGLMPPMIAMRPPAGLHEDQANSLTIGVADEHIGAVVGRGGRNIMEISQASGARIKISDRGDFMSGTSDRKVTITGSHAAIRKAEAMILHKVSSNSESELRG